MLLCREMHRNTILRRLPASPTCARPETSRRCRAHLRADVRSCSRMAVSRAMPVGEQTAGRDQVMCTPRAASGRVQAVMQCIIGYRRGGTIRRQDLGLPVLDDNGSSNNSRGRLFASDHVCISGACLGPHRARLQQASRRVLPAVQPLRGGEGDVESTLDVVSSQPHHMLNVLCSPVDLSLRAVCDGYPAPSTTMECDLTRAALCHAVRPLLVALCSMVTITESLSVRRPLHRGFMQALPQVPLLHVLHSLGHSSHVGATTVELAARTHMRAGSCIRYALRNNVDTT